MEKGFRETQWMEVLKRRYERFSHSSQKSSTSSAPPISVRFLYIYFAASIESKILNQIFHLSLRNILKATTIIKRLHREREREEETNSILIFCFQLERRKKKRRPTLLLLLLLPWKFHFLAISEPFIYFFFFLIWNGHVSAQRRLKVCSKPKRTQR